jgi:hypothetical protein
MILVFMPICYAGAEDKESVDPAKDKTLMPLPANHTYFFLKKE